MFQLKHISEHDHPFWSTLDPHLSEAEFQRKVRDQRGYILYNDTTPIGILRYNLFWDRIPFLTFLYIEDAHQKRGFGKQAMLAWETEMQSLGYTMLMTSTQVDEEAQHFYRKLGYQDKGSLFLDHTPFAQPQELFMIKVL